jgi:hypothetical protein
MLAALFVVMFGDASPETDASAPPLRVERQAFGGRLRLLEQRDRRGPDGVPHPAFRPWTPLLFAEGARGTWSALGSHFGGCGSTQGFLCSADAVDVGLALAWSPRGSALSFFAGAVVSRFAYPVREDARFDQAGVTFVLGVTSRM